MDFMTAYLAATSPGGLDTISDYRRWYPGGYVVHHGAADAAAVYHFADRSGDGADDFPPCAAAIKAPQAGLE